MTFGIEQSESRERGVEVREHVRSTSSFERSPLQAAGAQRVRAKLAQAGNFTEDTAVQVRDCVLILGLVVAATACADRAHRDPNFGRQGARVEWTMPFELIDNRIFVDVMLDGRGPFKFMFDTGGRNCMTPEVAKNLGLRLDARTSETGAGEKSVEAWKAEIGAFQIGSISLRHQPFLVIDFSAIKRAFKMPAFDGVFGYELLERYAARVDFVHRTIAFSVTPPSTAGFSKIPFTLLADKPIIHAKIDDVDAAVLIDTGDRSALTVFSNLRDTPPIAEAFRGKPVVTTGYGVGGPIPGVVSNVNSVEIDSRTILHDVAARTPTTKAGFNAIVNVNASIGNEILRQFDVIFDYRNNLLYLKPNAFFGERTKFVPIPNPT